MDEKEIQQLKEMLAGLTGQLSTREQEMKDIRAELVALKALPASAPLPPVRSREKVFGYDLSKQGLNLHTKDEETKDRIAKWLINLIKSNPKAPNAEAVKFMQTYKAPGELTEAATTAAGYLVPEEFTAELLYFARLVSFGLSEARIWPMSSDVRRVPTETGSVSVSWTDEGDPITPSNPTVDEVVLTAKKLTVLIGPVTNELLSDSMIDITSWLTELSGEAQGLEIDNQILNGVGTPFDGILPSADVIDVVMGSGLVNFSDISGDDLSKMISALSVNKLANAKFAMHRTVLHYLRTAKAAAGTGAYQWANMAANEPATLWGYPYIISEKAPASTDSTAEVDTSFVVFGNFKNFAIGQRLFNTTLDIDPFSYFSSYRTQFRMVSRFAEAIGLPKGFVKLTTGS